MNSVWKYTFGTPEDITPSRIFHDKLDKATPELPDVITPPVTKGQISFKLTPRGCVLELPMEQGEQFYGMGLQLKSVNQNQKKKALRVNSDPVADTGDSHAPVPLYVSNKGYVVLVDTARYASFYFGTHEKSGAGKAADKASGEVADSTQQLYAARDNMSQNRVVVEVPSAAGVEVYVFGGPTMRDAVSRYNMFSGGGVLPPMWGLGVWYRTYGSATRQSAEEQIKEFREHHIPCDVYGLEPGWQTRAYSCSYVWNEERFPDPKGMVEWMKSQKLHVNLWEHLFVNPSSPIHEDMKEYSGDNLVWGGLVPDFSLEKAREIYRDFHERTHVEIGVSGYKLDECDNSDFISSPLVVPRTSSFPSGMDGEQMHSLMGMLYQQTLLPAFTDKNLRSYHAVRSSHAFASDMPFVLYSDLYDHRDFVRGILSSGFAGLLWSPEVRQCGSVEELIRRIQSVILSPMALVNAWMIPHAPWKQFDAEKNKRGEFLDGYEKVEDACRELFALRMRLLPYLYTAYYKYHRQGLPPFRALVMDYPNDAAVFKIDDQFMVGDSLMFAPVFTGQSSRSVYLPSGKWYDFFTGEEYEGGRTYELDCPLHRVLLFVKDGTLLPVADTSEYVDKDSAFGINLVSYGKSGEALLVDDDGESLDYLSGKQDVMTITIADGVPCVSHSSDYRGGRYLIKDEVFRCFDEIRR
ncbi:MAG: TIM-barrel domain-containing protein [Eubacteriales bacterium]